MFERRPFWSTILLLATLGALCWGCGKKEVGEEKVLARVGDEVITLKDFEEEMNRMPPHVRRRMARVEEKKKQLDRLIDSKLLLQEAERQGIADDPTIISQVEKYRSRLVAQKLLGSVKKGVAPVTDEDIQEHYNKKRALYQTRKQIKASHILLKDEAEAQKVLKKAKAPGANFAALAKEFSQDRATKDRGGDLGYFSPGRMVRQFEEVAFALEKPGDISDIVKSPFGYHIIKLEDKKAAEPKTLAQVQGEIRRQLTSERQNEAQEAFLEEIKSRSRVEVNEELLSGEAEPEVKPQPPVEEEEPAEEPEEEED
jgi:peptidyl-prolyl cis-trans isomerase C